LIDHIDIDGQKIPLTYRHNKQARRIILRFDPKGSGLIVTLPPKAKPGDAITMAQQNKVWIANHLPTYQKALTGRFYDGGTVPVRGRDTLIRHSGNLRGLTQYKDDHILVHGDPDALKRRVSDWLKAEARTDIQHYAYPMADQLGKTITQVRIRDMISRWGSCTTTRTLCFNWRLIMAPSHVLRYVVAHEVAHLDHMNHSPAFWACVRRLDPEAQSARAWLKRYGSALLQKGR